MKYNFTKVKMLDITGAEIKNPDGTPVRLYQDFAKIIHSQCHTDLELVNIAKEIYEGKEVEIDKTEIETIKTILLGEKSFIDASIKKTFKDYIETVKEVK